MAGPVSSAGGRRYKAFLSYSHRDAAAGDWLHRAIESYMVPRDLQGRPTPHGPVPANLRPVFRDRFDLSAAPSLQRTIEQALDASDYLLVLCSNASAKSPYVDAEIRRFKMLGRGDRILPLILDGEPHDPNRECFPAALKFKVGPSGALTAEPDIEPIAADAREHADGRDLARLKIISGLLGVGLDDIRKREAIAERARRRLWMGVAGLMGALAAAASIAAIIAVERTRDAERRFDLAFKAAVTQVKRVDALQDQMGVSEPVLAGLMGDALTQLDKLTTESGAQSDSFRFNRAEAHLLAADLARRRGQSDDELRRVEEAIQALEPLGARDLDNANGWRGELAAAYDRRGDVLSRSKAPDAGAADFARALSISEEIGTRAGATPADQAMLATQYGSAAEHMAGPAQADQQLALMNKALALRRTLAADAPVDLEIQRGLGLSLLSVAKAKAFRQGASDADKAEAETVSSQAVRLFTRLSDSAPRNADLAHLLGNAFSARGDVRIALGRIDEARGDYLEDLRRTQSDADENPHNARTQLDYAVALGRIGLIDVNTNRKDEGFKRLRAALEVETRVAGRDPADRELQDLVVKRTTVIARRLNESGDQDGAREAFAKSAAFRDKVAATLPSRGDYAVDSIGQHLLFSRFLEALGRKAEAITELKTAHAIGAGFRDKFDPASNANIAKLIAKLESDLAQRL